MTIRVLNTNDAAVQMYIYINKLLFDRFLGGSLVHLSAGSETQIHPKHTYSTKVACYYLPYKSSKITLYVI